MINQSESGQFLVCGDTTGHGTLSELIDYYRTRPIEPFGEHLTSTCAEVRREPSAHFLLSALRRNEDPIGSLPLPPPLQLPNEELYDIIQVNEKPPVGAPAPRSAANQRNSASELPTRLPKRPPAVSLPYRAAPFTACPPGSVLY